MEKASSKVTLVNLGIGELTFKELIEQLESAFEDFQKLEELGDNTWKAGNILVRC